MAGQDRAFWIAAPGSGEIRMERLPIPGPDEVLVRTLHSGVSRGTETVRPPRLILDGDERREALALITDRLACRPALDVVGASRTGDASDSRSARATPASAAR